MEKQAWHFYDFDETFGWNGRGPQKYHVCNKPMVVVDYNRGKCAVDLSDQMIAYSTPHRRTLKWYIKLALELLLNTSISNAMILYKQATKTKIKVSAFIYLFDKDCDTKCRRRKGKRTWHENFAESAIKKMLNSQDQKLLRIGPKRWPPIVQIVSMSHIYV